MKTIFKKIYWYDFHIYKLNNLKVIHHLYIFPMFDSNFVKNDFFY
jgi:hypothetical protein